MEHGIVYIAGTYGVVYTVIQYFIVGTKFPRIAGNLMHAGTDSMYIER